jgi:hypothetical protein
MPLWQQKVNFFRLRAYVVRITGMVQTLGQVLQVEEPKLPAAHSSRPADHQR